MAIPAKLAPFFSTRFLKFCSVGASGVVVNLGFLWFFLLFGVHESVASALAIEVSILSNFVINELWTFRDQRENGSATGRAVRFQLVSLVGAAIQWVTFVATNILWLWLLEGSHGVGAYFTGCEGFVEIVRRTVVDPPEIGTLWLQASQLAGIAVATGWNFLANVHWTWSAKKS